MHFKLLVEWNTPLFIFFFDLFYFYLLFNAEWMLFMIIFPMDWYQSHSRCISDIFKTCKYNTNFKEGYFKQNKLKFIFGLKYSASSILSQFNVQEEHMLILFSIFSLLLMLMLSAIKLHNLIKKCTVLPCLKQFLVSNFLS